MYIQNTYNLMKKEIYVHISPQLTWNLKMPMVFFFPTLFLPDYTQSTQPFQISKNYVDVLTEASYFLLSCHELINTILTQHSPTESK